jgi:uncharacterized alkaline shock family protein YloU
MLYKEKTGRGKIRYGENIIGSIARRAVEETDGRAVLADVKGRQIRNDGTADDAVVDATFSDGVLDVRIYILVRFGSSIKNVCNDIDRIFRSEVLKITGAEVSKLTIAIKGLLAKNISKRDIEVTTHAGDTSGN